MPTPESKRLQVSIELPPDNASQSLGNLLEFVQEIGGRVIDLTVAVPELTQEPPKGHTIDETFPEIALNAFTQYATLEASLTLSWAARLWRSLSEATTPSDQRELVDKKQINMNLVRGRIREMERGERVFWGLGKTTWDAVVELNNNHITSIQDYVLPWIDDIHRYLTGDRSSSNTGRINAIRRIDGLYQELQTQSGTTPVKISQ